MNNSFDVKEIRILPMDKKEEFKTEEEVRKFLSVELIQRDGKYYYRERGMDIEDGCVLVLFQYDTAIVGYGILKDIESDICTHEINGKTIQYNGYFQFFAMSIHNVSHITLGEIQQIDDRITHFSNSKWRIGAEHFNKICHLLLQKQVEFEKNRFD
ncbi:MAG: hypothetical protein NC543_14330 [bacterium]|nr:hypothetical protein [bacterium]MCM1376240.1 hypothetical protein [Muribaculum sp.]